MSSSVPILNFLFQTISVTAFGQHRIHSNRQTVPEAPRSLLIENREQGSVQLLRLFSLELKLAMQVELYCCVLNNHLLFIKNKVLCMQ